MKKNKISKALTSVLALTGASMFFVSPATLAADEEEAERIVVTGSRIKHSSAQMTTPTTIIDAEAIAQSGVKNIGDLMNKLPALLDGVGGAANNTNNGGSIDNAGLELANLRGLGTNRTLVLVDGRRHVAGAAGTSSVDMSMIPASLIQRVEIITGGASAIYGADAVTGVVNFILRKNFEGLEIDASAGKTAKSDGETQDLSLTWGTNYANGKGNLTVHASYSDEDEIPMTARDYANVRHEWRANPANTGPSDGISDQIFYEDVRFQALNAEGVFYVPNENYAFGSTPITDLPFPTFAMDPIAFPFIPVNGGHVGYDTYTIDRETGQFRDFISGKNCQVVPCDGGDGFRTEETGTLNSPSDRLLFSLNTHYDLSNEHRIYAELKYGKVESAASTQATVFHDDNFGPLIPIYSDNPFRPQELVDLMTDRDLDVVALAVVGMNARSETERETKQLTFGGEGSFGDYDYTYYIQHGQVETTIHTGDALNANYYRALDAVADANGNPVCRAAAEFSDCVAYNPINGQASDAAKAYAGVTLLTESEIEQTVASFTIGGELIETDAGVIDFVVGLEYRDELSRSNPDPLTQAVDPDGIGSGLVGSTTGPTRSENSYLKPTNGSYDVAEVFGEVLIPLVEGASFADAIDLELAARYADHSVTGGDVTYKTALNWALDDELRIRSTYSRAVRAPNIDELFAPEQISGGRMTDPCHGPNQMIGPDDGNRQANCAALGIGPEFQSLAAFGTRSIATSGNKELNPEKADTYTFGVVYSPLSQLNIAIDYWNIEIEDAITTFDSTDILNNCVDGQSLNDAFCNLVNRDSLGQIVNVSTTAINAARFVAAGTDFDINYTLDLSENGLLNFSLKGTYLDERKFQQNAEDPTDIRSEAGAVGTPRVRGLFTTVYQYHDFTASWTMNYIGESTFNKEANPEQYPDWFNNKVEAYTYHSVYMSYQLNDDLNLYVGVDNASDKKPQALPNLNSGGLLYDGIGRKYYAGVRYKF